MRTRTRSRLARAALASGLVLTALAPLTAQAATSTYQVTSTIPVGVRPIGIAVNATTNTVYVTNQSDSTVSVIDGATGLVTGSAIPVGSAPIGVAVDESTNTVYVANRDSSTVSVINRATNSVSVITGVVFSSPIGVAVDASTHTLYVTNSGGTTVSVINTLDNTLTKTITVGPIPSAVAVNASTNTVYVTNAGSTVGGNSVSVINGATNAVTSTIPVGAQPQGVAVDASTNTVYVTNSSDSTVSVINGGVVTSTITVGSFPQGVAVNASTNTVYVANRNGPSVSVIDGATGLVTGSAIPVGSLPYGVAVNASTNTVYVANNNGNSVSVLSAVVAPSITTSSLPAATVGTPYSATVTATGTVPITFTVTSGALPGGLVLGSSTGVVSGTPNSAGSVTFTLTATNSAGADSKSYTVTVTPALAAPVFTAATPPTSAVVGTPYTYTFTATGYPAPEFTVPGGDLPAGLTLNSTTGVVSGTPTTPGGSTFTVTATNTVTPDAVTGTLTVTVTPALVAPVFTAATPPTSAVVGTPYTYTFTATGYPAPEFTVTSGALPGGLTLNSTTGVVSGTPTTVGSATFTLTATNSAGTDSQDYTVAAAAAAVAPSITTDTLPAATVGTPYSATVTTTGTGPITFTVSSGALPGGLVLGSSTGVVSGTPTSAGSAAFTLTATNSAGTDSQDYTVAVAAAPVLAFTGFDVLPWGVGGVLTLLVGAVLLVLVAKYPRSHAA